MSIVSCSRCRLLTNSIVLHNSTASWLTFYLSVSCRFSTSFLNYSTLFYPAAQLDCAQFCCTRLGFSAIILCYAKLRSAVQPSSALLNCSSQLSWSRLLECSVKPLMLSVVIPYLEKFQALSIAIS